MKKLLIVPILALIMNTAFAQANPEKTGSLLWRISGNNLTQPSYIFGTHHLFPLSFLETVSGLNAALENTQQVVGELIMSDMMAMTMQMQSLGMMPRDTTWQMLLSPEDFRFVDEQLTEMFGMGLQMLGAMRPFMLSMMFTVTLYQQLFPETDPNQSMDGWFQQQAVTRGLPVIGLETVQDQMNAIGVGPLVQQAEDFVCNLRNVEYAINQVHILNRLYENADLIGLKGLLDADSPCAFSAEQEYALNNARNTRWLEKLPGIMAQMPSFVAVGALHLVGEQGILYGLARLGYTVEAVK
ncbi:MAG: TraB/GumN family protein [Bacteroidales bacterium]|nr:TraB/GumN family protein [Bacteroidales bacterium]